MNIKIESAYINLYNSESYINANIPYNSTVKTCYIEKSIFYYVLESKNDVFDNRMKECVFFVKSNTNTSFILDDYIYLGMQVLDKYHFTTNTNNNNVSFNLIDECRSYIFYVNVEKTTEEIREEKINEIVNE